MSTGTLEREVAKVLADILQSELGLDPAHCLLGEQKWDIPADQQLFVVVFDQTAPPIGGVSYLDTDETSPSAGKEVQESTVMHEARIEIMSFDQSARVRKEEVGMALASLLAQQLSERYHLQIGRAQAPVSASETEVAGRLQRYVIRVNVTALHRKVKEPPKADYYDKFNVRPGHAAQVNPPSITEEE